MKHREVRLTDEAIQDVDNAVNFYDQIEPGLGDYFFDSLRPLSKPWSSLAGFTSNVLAIKPAPRHDFLSSFITLPGNNMSTLSPYWIPEKTLPAPFSS